MSDALSATSVDCTNRSAVKSQNTVILKITIFQDKQKRLYSILDMMQVKNSNSFRVF